jgi:Na+-translocating ferredoxin:NAD+ oxidoreductase RnfA subunit
MTDLTRTFLDGIFFQNPVFMLFVGATLALAEARSTKSSFGPAIRFAAVFFTAGLAGGMLASVVPSVAQVVVYLAIGAAGIGLLRSWGELHGVWLGLPKSIVALAPLFGLQMIVAQAGDPALMLASAAGQGLGFALGFIIIGAAREQSLLAESSVVFKTNPVLLFTMAVFSLIMSGLLLL